MTQVTPVTSTTQDMVVANVKGSNEKPKCIHSEIPLQFVYGPEQTMVHFNEVNLIRAVQVNKWMKGGRW